jgi:hypothetical protein
MNFFSHRPRRSRVIYGRPWREGLYLGIRATWLCPAQPVPRAKASASGTARWRLRCAMPACLAPRRRTRRGEPVMRVQRAGGSREKGAKHEDGGDVERERERSEAGYTGLSEAVSAAREMQPVLELRCLGGHLRPWQSPLPWS